MRPDQSITMSPPPNPTTTNQPVDHDVAAALVEPRRAADRAARVRLAILPHAVEDGAVRAQVKALELARHVLHVVRRQVTEEVQVIVRVELVQVGLGHTRHTRPELDTRGMRGSKPAGFSGAGEQAARLGRRLRPEDVEVLEEAVAHDEIVREPDAVGAHRVPLAVVEVPNQRVVEVVDALPIVTRAFRELRRASIGSRAHRHGSEPCRHRQGVIS